jgi:hypothetical protein
MQGIVRHAAVAAGLLLWASTVDAQLLEVGPRIGLNYSTVSVSDDEEEASSLSGIGVGAFLRFTPGRIGVQAEVLYMRKGASQEEPQTADDAELRLNYIEIPITAVVPFGSGPATGFVFGGPAFAFEASCKATFSFGGQDETFDCDDADADVFERKTFDLGGVIGGGLRVAAGIGAFFFDVRYTLGFTNLVGDPVGEESIKNRNVSILVGYGFALSR